MDFIDFSNYNDFNFILEMEERKVRLKTKKTIRLILIIALIILIILLLLLFFGGRSFSKYRKSVESNGVADVAKPIFIVDGTEDIKIDGIEDTVYNFSVKNYSGLEISDVDMEYNIEIINNSKANLDFKLTKDGEEVTLTNNKSESISLKGITRHTDEYQLKIIYNNNPAIIEDLTGNVQIKVEAIQTEVV